MFADTFFKAGQKNKKLAVIVADISPAGSMEKFHRKFPKRFINTGVAEQSMIGLAAGMAMQGMRPFAYTIATFSLYRPFEMVRDDLCYQELPVTIVGIGGVLVNNGLQFSDELIKYEVGDTIFVMIIRKKVYLTVETTLKVLPVEPEKLYVTPKLILPPKKEEEKSTEPKK